MLRVQIPYAPIALGTCIDGIEMLPFARSHTLMSKQYVAKLSILSIENT